MKAADLLHDSGLGLRVLACRDRLERPLTRPFFTDLPDSSRYLGGGELVLTGLMWHRGPFDSVPFVASLAARDVTALVAGEAIRPVPDDLVNACERYGLPLVASPAETPLSLLMTIVVRRLDAEVALPGMPLNSHTAILDRFPAEVRRAYREEVLGKVITHDRRYHSDLVGTLTRFLSCSGSWKACARELNLHVNTVRYRIGRIEELTGRDLSSLEDRVDLLLALRA
jgi:hypothetical protein